MTKEERLKDQRERRLANGNSYTKKYEKTPKGFLMRLYRNMKSRIEGIQWMKAHLYQGKELLSKEEFYTWAESRPEFYTLFKEYQGSQYDRKLCPSVDRVDSSKGYTPANMEWVTHSENSRRGSVASKKKETVSNT